MLEQTQDEGVIIERVAALDIGKAEVVCCVRVPGQGARDRRLLEAATAVASSMPGVPELEQRCAVVAGEQ